jgi:putative nucleotidyltransferase with HDIG domain
MVRVLVVEDNPGDVRLIEELLRDSGQDAELSSVDTVAAALAVLEAAETDVVLLDLGLPDSQGIATLERVGAVAVQVPVIVLTGNVDTRQALHAVQAGAQDYLVKGHFDGEVLGRVIGYSIGRKAIEDQLRASQSKLLAANEQLERMVYDVVESMGRVVDYRDPYTQGHQTRVASVARAIAEEMGCGSGVAAAVSMAGLVHDIGKLSVPAEILSKPGRLSDIELMLVREHSAQGFEILKSIAFPWPVATIVLQHHERTDGTGYPGGLRGDEMLLESRILAVADVVEAMASHRPYRPAFPVSEAIREIDEHRSDWFDPDVVDSCVRLYEAGRLGL